MIRMYFSMGLAAAIVAFMVFSMADLERFVIPSKPVSYVLGTAEKKYDTFHIDLQSERLDVIDESPDVTVAEKDEEFRDKIIAAAEQPPEEVSEPDLIESDVAGLFEQKQEIETTAKEIAPRLLAKKPIEKALPEIELEEKVEVGEFTDFRSTELKRQKSFMAPVQAVENGKGIAESVNQFQILNQPVTKPAPESVVINSIYLSDQSIPINSQMSQAFLPEVIVDSGIIQAVETPRSVLVTVEKMPVPIKIIPPEYPLWARKNGISGTVWVKAHVNEKGDVEAAEIASSNNPGYGFEEASLEAAKQCKYLPAEANGYKIGIWVIYPVNFVFKTEN
jgi:TonB family protein